MTEGALTISLTGLGIAGALVLVAGLVSVALQLELESKLALAAVRTVVQLTLIGYVLEWVFSVDRPLVVAALMVFMIAAASRAAIKRPTRRFRGATGQAFLTLLVTGLSCTFLVTHAVIGVKPWYQAQYVIPLLGMVLGNSLTGISLCLDTLLESLSERTAEIEAELVLGATRREALRAPIAHAVKRGMVPIINTMMVVGLVSLPGIMTGQILQGASPIQAVKYQIVIMFMLAAATSMGCVMAAILAARRLVTADHRLRRELILDQKQ